MAIRLGPPPGLARLRLQWHATRNQFLRHSRVWNTQMLTLRAGTHAWWQRAAAVTLSRWNLREHARQRQRVRQQAQLTAFADRYEDLVDLLCWAAKEGANEEQSRRYGELRLWMQTHYGLMRPKLRGFLHSPDNQYDSFECLFAPQNLAEVIHDTNAIENVMTTRAALDAYRATIQGQGL